MKQIVYILFAVICCFSSCSTVDTPVDEEQEITDPKEQPDDGYVKSSYHSIVLQEVFVETGVQTITTTDTYRFTSGLLSEHSFFQSYVANHIPVEMEQKDTLTYDDRKISVSNDHETYVYFVDKKGYTLSAERTGSDQKRTYLFSYTDNHLLQQVSEFIDGILFSKIEISYNQDNNSAIVSVMIDNEKTGYHLTFMPQLSINTDKNEIPSLFLTELYPLSLHKTAMYAHLLGDPFPMLLSKVEPTGNEDSQEKVEYSYTFAANRLTSVLSTITSYGTLYQRYVSYAID